MTVNKKKSASPTIGVVMPLYNKGGTVGRALRSVMRQTHPADEIVVVDDGSTDDSAAIVRNFADPRLHLIQQANSGVSAARNRGIAAINTELVALLDADDEWTPNHLQSIRTLRARRPDCDLLASGYVVRTAAGVDRVPIVRRGGFAERDGFVRDYFALASRSDPPITSSSVVASRRALEEIGGFPLAVGQGEDLLTWARLALRNRVAMNDIATVIVWQPDFNSAVPTRRPEPEDQVGAALRELMDVAPSWQIKSLRAYVGQWHKMRGSMFLALGERRRALLEFKLSRGYAHDNVVVFKICMTVLPVGIVNRIIETWRALSRKPVRTGSGS